MPAAVVELLQQNAAGTSANRPVAPEVSFHSMRAARAAGQYLGDAVSYTLALQTALSICAGQVATLNQWRVAVEEKQNGRQTAQ